MGEKIDKETISKVLELFSSVCNSSYCAECPLFEWGDGCANDEMFKIETRERVVDWILANKAEESD